MKKVALAALLLLIPGQLLLAQIKQPAVLNDPDYDAGKPLRFGFSLGINLMDLTVKNSSRVEVAGNGSEFQYFADVTSISPGLNVNAISDFRLTENLHLRFLPGYSFGQRSLNFYKVTEGNKPVLETEMKLESSHIELPLGFKYLSQRHNNIRPYLILGGNYRIDLAAYKRLKIENGVMVRLQKSDLYYEVGFGIDFFLTYFKFSTEIKWSAGILNAISDDYAEGAENYRYAIDRMRSQILVISFHFE